MLSGSIFGDRLGIKIIFHSPSLIKLSKFNLSKKSNFINPTVIDSIICQDFHMSDKKRKLAKSEPKVSSGKNLLSKSPFSERKNSSPSESINPSRIRILKDAEIEIGNSSIVYWMTRDQRARDNWALLHAVEKANERQVPVYVVFNLSTPYLNAGKRQFGFMLRGLQKLEKILKEYNIPFFLLQGNPVENICSFSEKQKANLLITDFHPLKIIRNWQTDICKNVPNFVTFYEIDSHNIVPVLTASPKLEYAARTIRTKIYKHLEDYLIEFPKLKNVEKEIAWDDIPLINWNEAIENTLNECADVAEVDWLEAGEEAAMDALIGEKNGFLKKRIKNYSKDRNNPVLPTGISGMSPWLHFGHVSAQRCALEARKLLSQHREGVDAFLEELVIRRELSDNFCFFQPNYDCLEGAWDWAKNSLQIHENDKREFVYTLEQFEKAKTHDELWNAAQLEMVHYGKMHGFMRMYWAKKILEWSVSPSEALYIAIFLNDKYELDGRDPNGYVGCMWSICGVHDQGWSERPVFGKIRYMNYAGCKRKFDVDAYVSYVRRMVKQTKSKLEIKSKQSKESNASKVEIDL